MKIKRIQRKRSPGWKMPENTIYVGRPGKWGNPFMASEIGTDEAVMRFKECIMNNAMVFRWFGEIQASVQYERFRWMANNIHTLKGKNLACWCNENNHCHADVLLKIAAR